MREIKFRVWDKEDKKMFGVTELQLDIHDAKVSHVAFDENPTASMGDWTEFCDMDKIELMQYMGLNDKNGHEIYEGDIIKYDDAGGEAHTQVVRYDDEMGAFGCDRGALMDHFNCMWEIEVLGNIYENPELLKDR